MAHDSLIKALDPSTSLMSDLSLHSCIRLVKGNVSSPLRISNIEQYWEVHSQSGAESESELHATGAQALVEQLRAGCEQAPTCSLSPAPGPVLAADGEHGGAERLSRVMESGEEGNSSGGGGDVPDGDLLPVFCMAGNPLGGPCTAARLVVMARDPAATLFYTIDGTAPGPDRWDGRGRSPLVVDLCTILPSAADGGVVRAVAVAADGRVGAETAVAVDSSMIAGTLGLELSDSEHGAAHGAGEPMVRGMAPGLPAAEGGAILVGDVLVAVDGRPTAGLSAAAASALLAGPVGVPVVLTLRRPPPPSPRFSVDVLFRPATAWGSPPRPGDGSGASSAMMRGAAFDVRLVRARTPRGAAGAGGGGDVWDWAASLFDSNGGRSGSRLAQSQDGEDAAEFWML